MLTPSFTPFYCTRNGHRRLRPDVEYGLQHMNVALLVVKMPARVQRRFHLKKNTFGRLVSTKIYPDYLVHAALVSPHRVSQQVQEGMSAVALQSCLPYQRIP